MMKPGGISPFPDVDPMAVTGALQEMASGINVWSLEDSMHAPDVPPVTPDMNPYFAAQMKQDMMAGPMSMGGPNPMGMESQEPMSEMSGQEPQDYGNMNSDDAQMLAQTMAQRMQEDNANSSQAQDETVNENEQEDIKRRKLGV